MVHDDHPKQHRILKHRLKNDWRMMGHVTIFVSAAVKPVHVSQKSAEGMDLRLPPLFSRTLALPPTTNLLRCQIWFEMFETQLPDQVGC